MSRLPKISLSKAPGLVALNSCLPGDVSYCRGLTQFLALSLCLSGLSLPKMFDIRSASNGFPLPSKVFPKIYLILKQIF